MAQAPLCLGADPGSNAGLALVEPRPGDRPRLLCLRVVHATRDPDVWAEHAFAGAEAIARLVQGRPLLGWYELTKPPTENGWMGAAQLSIRRGQILQALTDAGLSLRTVEHVMPQTWASLLGVPRGKRGDGSHRLAEAERLVEMPEDTLRGLGAASVDAAEAVLIAAARAEKWARDEGLVEVPKKPRAKRTRKAA